MSIMRRAGLAGILTVAVATASVAYAQGAGPAGGRGAGGRGPIVPTTRDLGGGLTLISAGSNSVLAAGREGAILVDDRSPTTPGPDNRDQFIRTLYNAQKTGQGR